MTTWETATFEEIDMNAEIGAYQDDLGDPDDPIAEARPVTPARVQAREE